MDEPPAGPPPAPPSSVTLHDVAREAGVSVATASRALNGSARNVRQENADRVRAVAARLGYAPNLSAQAIAKGSTRTVALVVSDLADPYFSSIAAGVAEAAEQVRLTVTMAVTEQSPEHELDIVKVIRGRRPHAIILAGSRITGAAANPALIRELEEYQTVGGRVVMFGRPDLPFKKVVIDNVGGARRLALALVDRGYRRFSIFRAPDVVRTSKDRYTGFTRGLQEAGIPVNAQEVIETDFTRVGGYNAARDLLTRSPATEIIFTVNDIMAIGAMSALRDAGMTPGEQIAIAGFDDIPPATDVTPELTSVSVPLHQAGQEAMRLALADDDQTTVHIPTTVRLRTSSPVRHHPGAHPGTL